VSKIPQSLKECFYRALNFWQGGNYAEENGGLQIAVGLWILAIEEIGKYVLLKEASVGRDPNAVLEISKSTFKSHRIKSEKGQGQFKKWGIDLGLAGIPLTNETREGLWYVAWDDKVQQFKRAFTILDPGAITKTEVLGELMRKGLNKMHELQRSSVGSQ